MSTDAIDFRGLQRRRVALAATAFAVPTVLGVLETAQLLVRTAGTPGAMPLADALAWTAPRWLLYAPLAWAVGAVVRHFPLGGRPTPRALAGHAVAASAFAVLHLAACVVVYGFLLEGAPNRIGFRFSHLLTVHLAADLVAYAAAASFWSASHHARTSSERERAAAAHRDSFERARLDALRSRLRPHFLYNALNGIHVLASRGDGPAAAAMTASLAELLRSTFDDALAQEIPLGRELEILDRYLEVQRARFGERVRIERAISHEATRALVPSLVLQPLLENAFEHGLEPGPGPCAVRIEAHVAGDALVVSVADEGPGFDPDSREGLGLATTRERLRLLYGTRGALSAAPRPGGGALITLEVPLRRAAADVHTPSAPAALVPARGAP